MHRPMNRFARFSRYAALHDGGFGVYNYWREMYEKTGRNGPFERRMGIGGQVRQKLITRERPTSNELAPAMTTNC